MDSNRVVAPCRATAKIAWRRVCIALVWAAAVLGPIRVWAEAPVLRSAAELVEQALANNPGAWAMQAALDAAEQSVAASGTWPDPVLSWAVAPQTFSNETLGDRHILGLSQTLPWVGKRALSRRQRSSEREAQAQQLSALKLHLAAQTRSSFARWHYVEQALRANTRNQALLRELADVAQASYAAGYTSQQALLKAELRLVQLRRARFELERENRCLQAVLQALINQSPGQALGHPAALPTPPPLPARAQLQAAVPGSNPELAALDARTAARRIQVEQAGRDYYPDFKLNASYLGTLDPPDKRLQIGLALELPLNQGRRRAMLDRARAELARQTWEGADRRVQLEAQLSAAWAAAQAADQSVALYRDRLLPLARQNLTAARGEWTAGAGEFREVIDAQEELLDARLGLEKALADAWIFRAQLDELSGGALHAALYGSGL